MTAAMTAAMTAVVTAVTTAAAVVASAMVVAAVVVAAMMVTAAMMIVVIAMMVVTIEVIACEEAVISGVGFYPTERLTYRLSRPRRTLVDLARRHDGRPIQRKAAALIVGVGQSAALPSSQICAALRIGITCYI